MFWVQVWGDAVHPRGNVYAPFCGCGARPTRKVILGIEIGFESHPH